MSVLTLYPTTTERLALRGLYLDLQLHKNAKVGDICIYSNYIASLDGRIALHDKHSGEFSVPTSIANKRDWRLYQELAAQADVMLTSGRYFRQLDKGCAQDLLPVGKEEDYADLQTWRAEQGLKAQPDVVIVSASLDLPLAAIAAFNDRQVFVFTAESAHAERKKKLQDAGIGVIALGEKQVQGRLLKEALIGMAYRSAYMIAGPAVHRTLLADGVLNRLFLSTHLSLLGQNAFQTILQGEMPVLQTTLQSLYLDQTGGQMFGQYLIERGEK